MKERERQKKNSEKQIDSDEIPEGNAYSRNNKKNRKNDVKPDLVDDIIEGGDMIERNPNKYKRHAGNKMGNK